LTPTTARFILEGLTPQAVQEGTDTWATTGTWKPDPSFYPSPKNAMGAPPERLAYVVTLNPRWR
jgi:hypothetical protein